MSAFCGICTKQIVGPVRREPLGKNDALVAICDACATETVGTGGPRLSRGRIRSAPRDNRAATIRANRERLAKLGVCTNGEKHGPATRGRLCEECWRKWGSGRRRRTA